MLHNRLAYFEVGAALALVVPLSACGRSAEVPVTDDVVVTDDVPVAPVPERESKSKSGSAPEA
ncbi:MAG: hypothetical protein H0U42_07135 [Thermoleophilaceae bacterium]|nr:hypothetical protein [Thermoleophilaceae bacterium]